MVGFPGHLNSKQDVENLLALPSYTSQTKARLRQLIDGRFAWIVTGEIAEGESGVEDTTHKVIPQEAGVRLQMELAEDPGAQLFRMGFTVAEAEGLAAG